MRKARVVLGITVVALVVIGLFFLASAGSEMGFRSKSGNPYSYLIKQGIWLAVGLGAFATVVFFDYRKLLERKWMLWTGYGLVLALMVAVLFFRAINGSHRWIILGPVRIQPCELAKVMTVVLVSAMLVKMDWKIGLFWRGVVPIGLLVAAFLVLALAEPDFGSTMVIGATTAALLFVGGMRLWQFFMLGGLAGLAFLGYLSTNPNRMRRVLAWLPEPVIPYAEKCVPWIDFNVSADDADEANHQLDQALVAIRRGFSENGAFGAWFGNGFMGSMQKKQYLPENHTDFIFAIGAEEWGLAATLLVVALYVTFFFSGLTVARKCEDRFGRLLAFGASFLVFFQALFNIGVVTGMLPTKGLALPFMSYGGTNLLSALVCAAIIYGVSRRSDLQKQSEKSTIQSVFYQ